MIPSDVSLLFNRTPLITSTNPEVQEKELAKDESVFPTDFEQADSAYEKLIHSICKNKCSNNQDRKTMENGLRNHKKIILYELQKLKNAGFTDTAFAHKFIEGANNLEQIADRFFYDRNSFDQDLIHINDQAQDLVTKISQAGDQLLSSPLAGAVTGAVGGGISAQQINPLRDYLYGAIDQAIDIKKEILSNAKATVELYDNTLCFSMQEWPRPLEEAIVNESSNQKKVLDKTRKQLEMLENIQDKIGKRPISKTSLKSVGAIVGGVIGVAIAATLECADAKPAH